MYLIICNDSQDVLILDKIKRFSIEEGTSPKVATKTIFSVYAHVGGESIHVNDHGTKMAAVHWIEGLNDDVEPAPGQIVGSIGAHDSV